jgi:hypothetical protein
MVSNLLRKIRATFPDALHLMFHRAWHFAVCLLPGENQSPQKAEILGNPRICAPGQCRREWSIATERMTSRELAHPGRWQTTLQDAIRLFPRLQSAQPNERRKC